MSQYFHKKYALRFGLDLDQKPPIDQFYTQLELSEYKNKLPFIHDIEFFCIRLHQALLKNEKICIYADFDTDAVTATGVMYWGLIDLGFNKDKIKFYTPDRFTEGYGVNIEAIDWISKEVDLIITVDCGINSTAEADVVLKNKKADLLITDHHHLTTELPNCLGVCNPRLSEFKRDKKLSDSRYKTLIKKNPRYLNFMESIKNRFEIPESNTNPKLSHSVTGVGVAWFCLVWLGYFIEEYDLNI
jgi:hypothetical protein